MNRRQFLKSVVICAGAVSVPMRLNAFEVNRWVEHKSPNFDTGKWDTYVALDATKGGRRIRNAVVIHGGGEYPELSKLRARQLLLDWAERA